MQQHFALELPNHNKPFLNFLLPSIAILHIQSKTLVTNRIDVKKNQESIKQVFLKSNKTKTSFLNGPTLTKDKQHIRKQIEILFIEFSTFFKGRKT
jgi:hypothetical protein